MDLSHTAGVRQPFWYQGPKNKNKNTLYFIHDMQVANPCRTVKIKIKLLLRYTFKETILLQKKKIYTISVHKAH